MVGLQGAFYGDESLGLASPELLAKIAGVSLEQAEDFIRHQEVNQRFRKLSRSKLFLPITAEPWTWQVDLMFYGTTLIPVLVCVEITSRLLRTAVLRNKEARTVAEAFEQILDTTTIKAIETDDGSEFKGAFAKLLKEKGIEHLVYPSTEASNTALAKVERVNGTLRTWLNKMPNAQTKIYEWMPKLEDFYNSKRHSSTKQAPQSFQGFEQQTTKERIAGRDAMKLIHDTYKIGTRVRIAKKLNVFGKKSQARWNKEVHTITGREGNSFFVDGKDAPLRAWEMLPIEEPVGYPEKVDVEIIPRPKPVFVEEPRSKRVPKRKAERVEAPTRERKPRKEPVKYIVEAILDHKRTSKGLEFLTKYVDFPNPSWQPARNFGDDNPVLKAYLEKHRRLKL